MCVCVCVCVCACVCGGSGGAGIRTHGAGLLHPGSVLGMSGSHGPFSDFET
jgi:hypothetical protein